MSASSDTERFIELRSDTFTKPTPAMRQAIANAEVGDDMVGEDPTVNRLEARMAEILGKQAAVLACSGTQSNQMGVWAHCQPGDELLIEETGHIANWEAGGPAVLRGVTTRLVPGEGGMLEVSHLLGRVKGGSQHVTPTRLLCVENTTNMGGGRVYPLERLHSLCNWAHDQGLATHLDGARLFNACIAAGYAPQEAASGFDTVSVCFSKGLGCPVGSILVGSEDLIAKARKARKIMGGALRQSGIFAAAALHALDHHVDRLAEDHHNARVLAEGLAEMDEIDIDLTKVETNLVFFEVREEWGPAPVLADRLRQHGIRLIATTQRRIRACTHLDVTEGDIDRTLEAVRECLSEPALQPEPGDAVAGYR